MERPNKFKATLISPGLETIDQFALKTQLEVMLEKLVAPEAQGESEKEILQPLWEILVEMGFKEEVARLAVIESDNNIERAIELAIPIESKIRAENVLSYHANAGNLEKGLYAYFKARLEHLTSFCLLCDNVVENQDTGKSCVCSRYLCEWQFKQIGLVPTSSIVKPRLVQGLPPAFNIIALSAGEDHSVACFQNGAVYSWGRGDRGQLGDATFRTSASAVHLASSETFCNVAAGNGFTIGLSTEGDLWVWGTGVAELGLDREEETLVPKPTKIPVYNADDTRVVFKEISVANRLCFAIARDNTLYVWGGLHHKEIYAPTIVANISVRSVSAHAEHSVCVDMGGKIFLWTNDKNTFEPTKLEQKYNSVSQPKTFSSAISFGNTVFAYTMNREDVCEFLMTRENDLWVLKPLQDHFGVKRYAGGHSYGVFAQNGTVRVMGTGSGVMGLDETTVCPNGVEISQIRNAELLAAGPHHVICLAMNDRVVYGQSEADAARDVFVYQWGRDHTVQVDVVCKADIRRQNELKWAQLADQAAAIALDKGRSCAKLGCEPYEDDQSKKALPQVNVWDAALAYVDSCYPPEGELPHENPFEKAEDLEKWTEQFIATHLSERESNTNVVVEDTEQDEKGRASEVLDKCYEIREQLTVKIDYENSQLVIDLNHPAVMLRKIEEEKSFKDINVDINAKDIKGNTVVSLAMIAGDYDTFTKVLDLNPDVDAMNNEFEFPLDIAVACGSSYSKAFVVSLVEKGATKYSALHKDEIVDIISRAAEYMPRLTEKLNLFMKKKENAL
eukprot:TRINITY_DN416_c0_g1_i1.p1 TRINITY_DN416_c0_g1~~TRINITY_DN416_c0_g1_i1.p1  ORF type:complete len:854 (-),score=153.91 TRINITY_DN416_c0_g1_i1:128-2494(-)